MFWKTKSQEGEQLMFIQDQRNMTAESGQKNATLPCRAPNTNTIVIVEWSRADLGEKYVLLYRDGQFLSDDQHQSFKNRVDLQDRQMKDGDVSLILKNVTTSDNGTYMCCIIMAGTTSCDPISIIYLHVDPPGQTGGHTEDEGKKDEGKKDGGMEDFFYQLILGLMVSAIYTATIVHVICTIRRQQQDHY
ncbi:uncharacterized protein LOC143415704 [Maylandia zebra]|uniref:uncharacterized protein LOC143415704 n=1 Tax=Maylandia zebra TaxID=106582 RepID=UPI00403CBE5E